MLHLFTSSHAVMVILSHVSHSSLISLTSVENSVGMLWILFVLCIYMTFPSCLCDISPVTSIFLMLYTFMSLPHFVNMPLLLTFSGIPQSCVHYPISCVPTCPLSPVLVCLPLHVWQFKAMSCNEHHSLVLNLIPLISFGKLSL